MTVYRFRAIRRADGVVLHSDTINDALNAGIEPMRLAVVAALLHSHPEARGLTYDDIDVEIAPEADSHSG
ncbi:hypothetical protein [Paracoccus tibetensis]|uniref:Uncharacterized protein n=1 Tax=Paracoccus tibetensis TaxID=336292 RepID=A0A1G5HT66_9RHOB|nr:hypothetical protein [Paracoccus tibetensis]SCY66953.1 hypothetical protein SAMN05660710_02292 [Paracoccus tibetensis]